MGDLDSTAELVAGVYKHMAANLQIMRGKLARPLALAGSYARIYETNLKKQGILALTFTDPQDNNLIREDDRIDLTNLASLGAGTTITSVVKHSDGMKDIIQLNHSFSETQVAWFRAGSALNLIAGD